MGYQRHYLRVNYLKHQQKSNIDNIYCRYTYKFLSKTHPYTNKEKRIYIYRFSGEQVEILYKLTYSLLVL